jgi:hypothetical protein
MFNGFFTYITSYTGRVSQARVSFRPGYCCLITFVCLMKAVYIHLSN